MSGAPKFPEHILSLSPYLSKFAVTKNF